MSSPLISIVMPSLNQAAFIPLAVESVLSQYYSNLELIVADGGSTDGTLAWLAAKQVEDSRLVWFSEGDSGPANAINKALSRARGTVIGWLNSDDLYAPGAITRAVEALQSQPGRLMVYGHGQHIDEHGSPLDSYPTLPPSIPLERFADGCFICQPTVFFLRTMFVLLGKLDESLKTAFDFDYWLRAFKSFQYRIGFVDALQAQSRLHGACITLKLRRTVAVEGMKVIARHLGSAPGHWVLTYVDELLANPTGVEPKIHLREHVTEMLEEISLLMKPSDFKAFSLLVHNDQRIDRFNWLDPATNGDLCMQEYRSGSTTVTSTPSMLTLETTSLCNLRCVMCPHAIDSVQRPKHLEEELVQKLGRFIHQSSSIQLHGIGEPLISPAFWGILNILPPAKSCESSINTNLTVLSDDNLEKILGSELKIVNVSLDAARPETYSKIRGFTLNIVLENIRKLIAARDFKGARYPLVYLNMTLMRSNIEELSEFVALGHQLKADKIVLWHLNRWSIEEMSRYKIKRGEWFFDYGKEGLWNYPELSNRSLRQAEEEAKKLGISLCLDNNKSVYFEELEGSGLNGNS